MREHKQSINMKLRRQAYSPLMEQRLSLKDPSDLKEDNQDNFLKLKVVKTARPSKMTDEEIIRETIDDYRRNKKIRDKFIEEGKEQKKLEELKAQIPTFTHKNISQISASLTDTEN